MNDLVLAKLILMLLDIDGWAYELFPEGDYSKRATDLRRWAEEIVNANATKPRSKQCLY